jgi:hypothetical protein
VQPYHLGPSPDLLIQLESTGSACGVWRDGLRTYVLSAAHVVATAAEGEAVHWIASGKVGFGITVDPSLAWLPVAGGRLDAGLASIRVGGPFGATSTYPWAGEVMAWHEIDSVKSVRICGHSGEVFATFVDKVPAGLQFSGIPHRYGRLLRCRYDYRRTEPGDSGAPVISLPEGKLMGMHVATSKDRLFSYAVPAIDILDTFGPKLPGFRLRP